MPPLPKAAIETRILREIERRGLMLVTDAVLPSVTRLVVGEPVKGSWWSHPKGRQIYSVLTELAEDTSLLLVKLVEGKLTFVHRALWPELLAVATARESWQMKALSREAKALLEEVDSAGSVELDRKASRAARDLEDRLLAYGSQVHTESGAHAKILTSWARWATAARVGRRRMDPSKARAALEKKTEGELPWTSRAKKKTARPARGALSRPAAARGEGPGRGGGVPAAPRNDRARPAAVRGERASEERARTKHARRTRR
jgi:hypothetical protein